MTQWIAITENYSNPDEGVVGHEIRMINVNTGIIWIFSLHKRRGFRAELASQNPSTGILEWTNSPLARNIMYQVTRAIDHPELHRVYNIFHGRYPIYDEPDYDKYRERSLIK